MSDYSMTFQDMIAILMRYHTDEQIARLFADHASMAAQFGDPKQWAQRADVWEDVANDMPEVR